MNYCRHWKSGLVCDRVASTPRGIAFGGTSENGGFKLSLVFVSQLYLRATSLSRCAGIFCRERSSGEFEVRAIHRM